MLNLSMVGLMSTELLDPLISVIKKRKNSPRLYSRVICIRDSVACVTDGFSMMTVQVPAIQGSGVIDAEYRESQIKFPDFNFVIKDFDNCILPVDSSKLKMQMLALSPVMPKAKSMPVYLGIADNNLVLGQFSTVRFNPWLLRPLVTAIKTEREFTATVSADGEKLKIVAGPYTIYILAEKG